jgi:phage shock protein A
VGAAHRFGELREVDIVTLLKHAEDPRKLLGYTAAQREKLLGTIRSAITDIAARREHAQLRERRLQQSADRLLKQAWQARAADRGNYARQAMAWQATIRTHAAELNAQQALLRASHDRLSAIFRELQAEAGAYRITWDANSAAGERAGTL